MTESDAYLRTLLAQAAAEDAFLDGLASAGNDDVPAAKTLQQATASVSLMITQRQRQQLRECGFSDEAIRAMTPTEAHRHLERPL